MKFSINAKQRGLLLIAAGILAVSETYRIVAGGTCGLNSLGAYGLVTVCAFLALRSRRAQCPPPAGKVAAPSAPSGLGAPQAGSGALGGAQNGDAAFVEKCHHMVVAAGKSLYQGLGGAFSWGGESQGGSVTTRQIFQESCTILGYYLVCLSFSGGSSLVQLQRVLPQLKQRTTASIMGMEGGQCLPGAPEADSPACKALNAHNISLIDSFGHLFDRTVENFRHDHPFPLNDLLGGILMLFEGHMPTEPDYWENKYGAVVYEVLDQIADMRRGANGHQA